MTYSLSKLRLYNSISLKYKGLLKSQWVITTRSENIKRTNRIQSCSRLYSFVKSTYQPTSKLLITKNYYTNDVLQTLLPVIAQKKTYPLKRPCLVTPFLYYIY
eukprot:snap_masked-scaffold_39-processed-gene-1.39-mRNA-1 protein AED:1.00 eAED:1.00 QI:0/0/0/0/1/1/2/0/102